MCALWKKRKPFTSFMCVSEWMKPFTSFHVMADADHRWKTVFLKHFSRSLGSKCKQFRSDLLCLLIGIKPALLLDYLPPDASKIQQFLIEALQLCKSCDWVHNSRDWTLSNQNLCILTIGKDVLIVNSTALSKNIASPIFFIDITKGLSSPVILTDSMIISSIEESFLCCFDRLLKSRSSICFNTEVNVPIVQYPDTDRTSDEHKLNVCTLFGRLLCYPVVYWFESSKGYCLDTEELVRHTVEVIMKKHVQEFKGYPHILYSFTVPGSIFPRIQGAIETWYSNLKSLALSEGLRLNMKTESVRMQAIAL